MHRLIKYFMLISLFLLYGNTSAWGGDIEAYVYKDATYGDTYIDCKYKYSDCNILPAKNGYKVACRDITFLRGKIPSKKSASGYDNDGYQFAPVQVTIGNEFYDLWLKGQDQSHKNQQKICVYYNDRLNTDLLCTIKEDCDTGQICLDNQCVDENNTVKTCVKESDCGSTNEYDCLKSKKICEKIAEGSLCDNIDHCNSNDSTLFCLRSDKETTGKCTKKRSEGEECYKDHYCQEGLQCVANYGKKGTCQKKGLGGKCTDNSHCDNGKCINNVCVIDCATDEKTEVDCACSAYEGAILCKKGMVCAYKGSSKSTPGMNLKTPYYSCINEQEFEKLASKACPKPYSQISMNGTSCHITYSNKLPYDCKCAGNPCKKGSYCIYKGRSTMDDPVCMTKEDLDAYMSSCKPRCLGMCGTNKQECYCGDNICKAGESCNLVKKECFPTSSTCRLGKNTCSFEDLKNKYGADTANDCYSCMVVSTLIETFLKAAAKVYFISQEAGIKILMLGFIIWIALFSLKNLSQVTSLEPANMIDQLLKMGFKMIVAYVAIVIGARALGTYLIEPFIMFSSNFASQLLANSEKEDAKDVFVPYGKDEGGDDTKEELEKMNKHEVEELKKQEEQPQEQKKQEGDIATDISETAEKLVEAFINIANENASKIKQAKNAKRWSFAEYKKIFGSDAKNLLRKSGEGAVVGGTWQSNAYCGYGLSRSLKELAQQIGLEELDFLKNNASGNLPYSHQGSCYKVSTAATAAGMNPGTIVGGYSNSSDSGRHAFMTANTQGYTIAFNNEHTINEGYIAKTNASSSKPASFLDTKCMFEQILKKISGWESKINTTVLNNYAKGNINFNSKECQDYVNSINKQTDSMYNNNLTPEQQRATDATEGDSNTVAVSQGDSGIISANAPIAVPETDANGKIIPEDVRNAISKASKQYKINPALIASIIQTESNYIKCVVSDADCHGYMQVMRTYFKDYGNKVDPGIAAFTGAFTKQNACQQNQNANANIYNAEHNIMAGTDMFSKNLKKFGNVDYALMAYNWGSGNLQKYLDGKESLPQETKKHMEKTRAYYKKITGNRELESAVARNIGALGSGACGGSSGSFYIPNTPLGKIVYKGDETILSASVIQSMINAQAAIQNRIADLQILGNALTCFASDGGAWVLPSIIGGGRVTDIFTWIVGAVIWCAGFMLVMSIAYYLLDISFKIGFMMIALPVVIGLWPFNMTKGKISVCLSVIMKAAATYAFLAISVNYSLYLVEGMIGAVEVPKLVEIMQNANEHNASLYASPEEVDGTNKTEEEIEVEESQKQYEADVTAGLSNAQYVKKHISLFSLSFVLILFSLIYSYKLIGGTVKDLVNKFFPDQMFGNESPMHSKAVAATKYAKDVAMKPVGLARDIAMHQSGRLAGKVGRGTMNAIAHPIKTGKKIGGGVASAARGAKQGASKAANWVSSKLGKGEES